MPNSDLLDRSNTNVRFLYYEYFQLRMIGEIGDRTIILTQGKYRKNGKAVTIELIKSKYLESGIERITYIDRNKL